MPHEFKFPDVGEGVTEGKLINWLVEEGEEIEEDQSIAEVETDKAVVEVPSPRSGTVLKLHAEEGETIKVGNVIATIGEAGEEASLAPSGEAKDTEELEEEEPAEHGSGASVVGELETPESEEAQATEEPAEPEPKTAKADTGGQEGGSSGDVLATPAVRKYAEKKDVDLVNVEGTGSQGHITKDDIDRFLEKGGGETEQPQAEEGKVLATPSTRKFARVNNVDINQVRGTGPAGRVTREDVQRYMEHEDKGAEETGQVEREPAGTTEAGRMDVRKTSLSDYDFEQYGDVEREEISGVRSAITDRMVESKYTTPHVTSTADAVVSELWDIREKEKKHAEERGVHLTFLPFIANAVISGLKEYPLMNASFDEEKGEIIKKKYYNIGIAVATDHGLMVPVIKNADDKSILEMAEEMNELAQRAREREISLQEMKGGTFTLTNYGSIGGDYGTPIVNFPEVGILGLGRINDKPVAVDGEVTVEKVLPLSLSFDHRIVDGAYAARFLMHVKDHLEDPDLMLID